MAWVARRVNLRGVGDLPALVLLGPGVREDVAQTGLCGLGRQPEQLGADQVVGVVFGCRCGEAIPPAQQLGAQTRRAGPSTYIQTFTSRVGSVAGMGSLSRMGGHISAG